MSLAQLQALPSDEVDNFVHYFKGLKRPGAVCFRCQSYRHSGTIYIYGQIYTYS